MVDRLPVFALLVLSLSLSLFGGALGHVQCASADEPKAANDRARGLKELSIPPRLYSRVQVLCVGINRYKSISIPKLEWAENDAVVLGEMLTKRYGYDVDFLLGRAATRAAFFAKLDAYQNGKAAEGDQPAERPLGANDALLIFFAGHGYTVELESFGRKGFLMPYDGQLNPEKARNANEWKEKAIDMEELGRRVREMNARHVLVLADACYSGFLGKRSSFGDRIDLQALALRKSRMVMTAGTEDQKAFERPELKHGLFSDALLRQLDVGDALSAREVFVGVRDEVARQSDGKMLPQLREFVIDNGEFVFVPKEIADKEVQTALKDVNLRLNAAIAQSTKPGDIYLTAESYDYRFSTRAAELGKEWEQRFIRFQDNASLGDVNAMAALFYCYHRGRGTEKDDEKALDWALRANETDQPIGKHVLGQAYMDGCGVEKNELQATMLFREAADAGCAFSKHVIATQLVAEILSSSLSEKVDRVKLADYLQTAAAEGIPAAKKDLAICMRDSQFGVPLDPSQALEMLQAAAEAGSVDASFALATWYSTGIGSTLQPDLAKSDQWLLKAAEAGHPLAQLNLSRLHLGLVTGRQFNAQPSEARRWIELAHGQGNVQATSLLGIMYADGRGVPKNDQTALTYFEQAAKNGDADASLLLAMWYWDGRAVKVDKEQSLILGEQAGRAGNANGWWMVGFYHKWTSLEAGIGLVGQMQRMRRARTFFLRGMAGGSERAFLELFDGNNVIHSLACSVLAGTEEAGAAGAIRNELYDPVSVFQAKRELRDTQRLERTVSGLGKRPFCGFSMVDNSDWLAKRLAINEPSVIVTLVFPETPAAKAGMREFDLLTEINGRPVKSSQDALATLAAFEPGKEYAIKIRRPDPPKQPTTLELKIVPELTEAMNSEK